jgi:pimeloyl-ACP methyl ester carboxylesterase
MSDLAETFSPLPDLEAVCRAFAVPDRVAASAEETALLSKATRGDLQVGTAPIAYWTFGEGPRVLLMHGWSSRGSHLGAFVAPLVASGFSAVLFDAPAHGESAGSVSSMIHAARTAVALAERLGSESGGTESRGKRTGGEVSTGKACGAEVFGIIAHSAGSMAALWALANGLSVRCSVHLGGPASLAGVTTGIARAHGLDEQQTQAFAGWAQRYMGVDGRSLELPALTANRDHRALLIHDLDDRVVPASQSQALNAAWPTSHLILTQGLGHRRILADAATIANTVEYFRQARQQQN